jgi:hypothetical protein
MLIRSIKMRRKAVKENNTGNTSHHFMVYSQELQEEKEDKPKENIITINPDMYTEKEIVEEKERQAETKTDQEENTAVKESVDDKESSSEENITEENKEKEAQVNSCHILKKNRNKKEENKKNETKDKKVPEIKEDYGSGLKELLEKVNDLSSLIYDVTSCTNYLTQNAVAKLSEQSFAGSEGDTVSPENSTKYADQLAADSAKLSKLAEELKDKALKLNHRI